MSVSSGTGETFDSRRNLVLDFLVELRDTAVSLGLSGPREIISLAFLALRGKLISREEYMGLFPVGYPAGRVLDHLELAAGEGLRTTFLN